MYMTLLFGDEKTNVVNRIIKNKKVRIMLYACITIMYVNCGFSGFGIENIIAASVLGVISLNILMIPERLIRCKKIDSIYKVLFVNGCIIISLLYYGIAGVSCVNDIFRIIIAGIIYMFVFIIIIDALIKLQVHLQYEDIRERDYDNMDGLEFEKYCAEVLLHNGFNRAEVTQGSGDFGIDIIALKNGVKYGIQCKRYLGSVGWHAVEEAKAGSAYYGCDVSVVLTNSRFTKQAMEGAGKIGVQLWDREILERMVNR